MKSLNSTAHWRHEYKYLCNAIQNQILQLRAEGLLCKDAHVDETGKYRIRSVYFDDIYNNCYYENEDGTDPRAKYRIRIYNGDSSYIVLEKKKKYRGMTNKESCTISEELCNMLLRGEYPDWNIVNDEKCKQLLLQMQIKNFKPVQIVEYERMPYVEKNGNVRITFDRNICSSNDINNFLQPQILLRPVMREGQGLMEVKWDSHLPSYIKNSFELDSLMWSTFSKFYICRKFNFHGGLL